LLLLLVFVVAAALWGLYQKGLQQALLASAAVAGLVLSLQVGRKDKAFVLRHMPGGSLNIFAEYLVLTLPVTLPALFCPYPWLFVLVQVAFFFIAKIRMDVRQHVWFGFLSRWIAPRDFEWLSGVRKNFVLLLLCYIAALGLCWLRIAPLVPLWIITVIVASFYAECEPLHILKSSYPNPVALLRARLRRHLALLSVVSVPVLLLHALWYPSLALICLAFVMVQYVLLSFAFLLKYATYRPDTLLTGNSLLLGLASVGVLIPFLLPVPLLMSLRYYRKAIANLKNYYHD
jgi:hypothetical protein